MLSARPVPLVFCCFVIQFLALTGFEVFRTLLLENVFEPNQRVLVPLGNTKKEFWKPTIGFTTTIWSLNCPRKNKALKLLKPLNFIKKVKALNYLSH